MSDVRRERILVTVKTYPTLSEKYGETVCTAGVREDGSWIRLYPVPFRRLTEVEQYHKYDWLECRVRTQSSDRRPESFRPVDTAELKRVDHLDTSDLWRERRRILLQSGHVYDRRDTIIDAAKNNAMSLCVFKPAEVMDFVCEPDDRDWDSKKLNRMREIQDQFELFEDNSWRRTFKLIPKLPYKFSYRFKDAVGKVSELQILDWEIGALYWNCLGSSDGDEVLACEKVRRKYLDEFLILGVFRLKGQSKRDGSIIVRSCKASLSPVYPIRDAIPAVNHASCPSLSSSGPPPMG